MMKLLCFYLLLSDLVVVKVESDPLTIYSSLVAGVGSLFSYFNQERCNSDWIAYNPKGLKTNLENKLYGQHIAAPIIFKAVTGFMSSAHSQKPLVLSLNGGTGTGKTHVSKMIAKNLYKKGMDSQFVHLLPATEYFRHVERLSEYKTWLKEFLKSRVSSCERSLFIFDEMDKMMPELIDVLKPYLDYHDQLGGISFRKSIFIFLSNAGEEAIAQTALDFWKAGTDREEIKLKDLEDAVYLSSFNTPGGLFQTSVIKSGLVDVFVPFLPLEKRHVIQCVLDAMVAQNLRPMKTVAEEVADEVFYFPKSERVFSTWGCKTIETRLSIKGIEKGIQ